MLTKTLPNALSILVQAAMIQIKEQLAHLCLAAGRPELYQQ